MRVPVSLFNLAWGVLSCKKDVAGEPDAADINDDSDAPQHTPSTDSAGEDFEMLDKSTDSLTKAKASGAQQGGRSNKRKGRKR